jgi:hypothetical protein
MADLAKDVPLKTVQVEALVRLPLMPLIAPYSAFQTARANVGSLEPLLTNDSVRRLL